MGVARIETRSAKRFSIAVLGQSATGKDDLSALLSRLLGKPRMITGNIYRGTALLALEQGLFRENGHDRLLTPEGIAQVCRWYQDKKFGLSFDRRNDWLAHVTFEGRDMTEAIRPKRGTLTDQLILEPAAAAIATSAELRPQAVRFLRRAVPKLGECLVVTKNPGEILPGIGFSVYLYADRPTSALYRLMQDKAATNTLGDEIDYLARRDGNHAAHKLDDVPKGALVIDTTRALLRPSGLALVAQKVCDAYLCQLAGKPIR